jgi:hypothetical protein
MADRCTGDASCGVDLIANLSKVADNIRGIAGNMGLRPYEVRIITARWTGGYRGEGVPEVVDILLLEPTPLIESISNIDQRLEAFGLDDVGSIQISEISLRYNEDILLGRDAQGNDPAEDTEVFYEVSLRTSVQTDPVLRRFTPTSTPTYDPDNLQYTLRLASARGERHRSQGIII